MSRRPYYRPAPSREPDPADETLTTAADLMRRPAVPPFRTNPEHKHWHLWGSNRRCHFCGRTSNP